MKILQRDLNRSTFVVWEMKRNVSVVKCLYVSECVCSKIIKEMPGLVGSGTPYIYTHTHTHTHIYIYWYICKYTYNTRVLINDAFNLEENAASAINEPEWSIGGMIVKGANRSRPTRGQKPAPVPSLQQLFSEVLFFELRTGFWIF